MRVNHGNRRVHADCHRHICADTNADPYSHNAPTGFAVSQLATCAQLAGTNTDGPLYQYIKTITTVNASDAAAIDKLRSLKDQLQGIADHAQPNMKQLIENLWSSNVNDFKAAGTELVTECH